MSESGRLANSFPMTLSESGSNSGSDAMLLLRVGAAFEGRRSVSSTLEETPRGFKVIDTVREKFSWRDCEACDATGYIGPQLMATRSRWTNGQTSRLDRQSERIKCEAIDLSASTPADQAGAGAFAVRPIFELTKPMRWTLAAFGSISVTIGHLAGKVRRQHCFTPPAIGAAKIRRGIFRTSRASFRPTSIAGSTLSSIRVARRPRLLLLAHGRKALRGFALGRKAWLFVGLDRGAERAAVMATLITKTRLTTSTRKLGLPTCSRASPIYRRTGCANCCARCSIFLSGDRFQDSPLWECRM